MAAIYRMLVNIKRNTLYAHIQTHRTMQKVYLRTAVKSVLQRKTQNVLFSHMKVFAECDIKASFLSFDF